MRRSLLLVGVLVGAFALSSTGLHTAQAARGAVLLRYRYALGKTLVYSYRERLTSTSAGGLTTTLLTFRQTLHITHVSAAGVATALLSESPHTLTTTSGSHRSVLTQPGQPPSTVTLYPDGHSSVQAARPSAGGSAMSAPLFPARPVSPGAQWSRSGVLTLGGFTARTLVIPDTEHLTFSGYGVVDGERVARITITVTAQRAGMAPRGSAWPNRVLVSSNTTSTISIGLTSGDQVQVVQDRTTTVRAMTGTGSTAGRVLTTLTTHTVVSRS